MLGVFTAPPPSPWSTSESAVESGPLSAHNLRGNVVLSAVVVEVKRVCATMRRGLSEGLFRANERSPGAVAAAV